MKAGIIAGLRHQRGDGDRAKFSAIHFEGVDIGAHLFVVPAK
jgi:hypothetical protein